MAKATDQQQPQLSPEYTAAKMAVMDAAIALGTAIRAMHSFNDGDEWADIEMANALDIIAEASTSDGRNTVLNMAMEIRAQAHQNIADNEMLAPRIEQYEREYAAVLEAHRIDACLRRVTA